MEAGADAAGPLPKENPVLAAAASGAAGGADCPKENAIGPAAGADPLAAPLSTDDVADAAFACFAASFSLPSFCDHSTYSAAHPDQSESGWCFQCSLMHSKKLRFSFFPRPVFPDRFFDAAAAVVAEDPDTDADTAPMAKPSGCRRFFAAGSDADRAKMPAAGAADDAGAAAAVDEAEEEVAPNEKPDGGAGEGAPANLMDAKGLLAAEDGGGASIVAAKGFPVAGCGAEEAAPALPLDELP